MPFGVSIGIPNVIIHAKFHVDRLRGFWAAGPPKVPFPILIGTTLTTVLHYRTDCETTTCVFSRVRPDHSRCRSATWICMCGHTRDPVIYSKFHRNPFRGFGAPWGQNLAFPFTLASRFYNSLYYRTSRDQHMPISLIFASWTLILSLDSFKFGLILGGLILCHWGLLYFLFFWTHLAVVRAKQDSWQDCSGKMVLPDVICWVKLLS